MDNINRMKTSEDLDEHQIKILKVQRKKKKKKKVTICENDALTNSKIHRIIWPNKIFISLGVKLSRKYFFNFLNINNIFCYLGT